MYLLFLYSCFNNTWPLSFLKREGRLYQKHLVLQIIALKPEMFFLSLILGNNYFCGHSQGVNVQAKYTVMVSGMKQSCVMPCINITPSLKALQGIFINVPFQKYICSVQTTGGIIKYQCVSCCLMIFSELQQIIMQHCQ